MQNIYYQWSPGSYSHQVAEIIKNKFNLNAFDLKWVFSFKDIFDNLDNHWWIWILPIENSYAWSVHQNLYLMRDYEVEIIWEYFLEVNHCLVWISSNVKEIKEVYSHPQALMQCENFIKKYNFKPISFSDTAGAAKYISEIKDSSKAAISSSYAAKIYWLNIIKRNINDQKWNTTRFLVVKPKSFELNISPTVVKKWTLLFKVKDQPAILFKCLWAFATRFINLTKIESIPTRDKKFEYMFWIDYMIPSDIKYLYWSLEELKCFTTEIKDLWIYGEIK